VVTTWSIAVTASSGSALPPTGWTLTPDGLEAQLGVDLRVIPQPYQSGSVAITMTSVDAVGTTRTAERDVPWVRSFTITTACNAARITASGTYTWTATPEGTFTEPITYRFTNAYFGAAGNPLILDPSIGATTGVLVFDYDRAMQVGAVRAVVSCAGTDARGVQTPIFFDDVPIGPAPLGAADPAATVWAVRLTFLPQGVPYTGPGAQPGTTTLNAGMFVEAGLRRDVPSYMQLGTQSFAPVTAEYVDDRWTDFTSDPPQLPDAPLPGMPTPHALDLHASMHNLYIRTSIAPQSSMSSMEAGRGVDERILDFSNIITCISTTDTQPGDVISNTVPTWDHPTRLQLTSLTHVRVSLTNSRNQLVDLNGTHWSVCLRLQFVLKNARKAPLSQAESRLISSVHERGPALRHREQYHASQQITGKKKKNKKKKKRTNGRDSIRAASGSSREVRQPDAPREAEQIGEGAKEEDAA
jgi:hypothetical protein